MTQEVRYTTIQHEPRIKLGLSNNDYCIADSIYHLSNHPDHRICEKSLPELAAFIGVERRTLVNITKKLATLGLIEKVKDGSRHLGHRPTEQWYQLIEQHRLALDQNGNGFRYTTVLHPPRLQLGITLNAYCIADSIYRLSNKPGHPNCTASLKNLGAFIGLSEKSANNLKEMLVTRGLVEKITSGTRHLGYRTTDLWYREVVTFAADPNREKSSVSPVKPSPEGEHTDREKSSARGKKVQSSQKAGKEVQSSREKGSVSTRKKVQPSREKSSNNTNNTYSNINKQQQLSLLLKELKISKKIQGFVLANYEHDLLFRMLRELKSLRTKPENNDKWLMGCLKLAAKGEYQFREDPNQKRKKLEEKRRSEDLAQEAEEALEEEKQARVEQWMNHHPAECELLHQNCRKHTPPSFQSAPKAAEAWVKSNVRLTVGRIINGEEPMPVAPPSPPSPQKTISTPKFKSRRIRKSDQPQEQLSLLVA